MKKNVPFPRQATHDPDFVNTQALVARCLVQSIAYPEVRGPRVVQMSSARSYEDVTHGRGHAPAMGAALGEMCAFPARAVLILARGAAAPLVVPTARSSRRPLVRLARFLARSAADLAPRSQPPRSLLRRCRTSSTLATAPTCGSCPRRTTCATTTRCRSRSCSSSSRRGGPSPTRGGGAAWRAEPSRSPTKSASSIKDDATQAAVLCIKV